MSLPPTTSSSTQINPAKLADVKLQNYVKKLKTNTQNDRATAARLMNEVRDGAVGQLLGVGENQRADLFRLVREELFKDGKELVLLIEDFTTLSGVQRGLLDVIKMEGVRSGEAERCRLRTALAVTENYLSPYDTLKTRVGYEFVLREQPAAEAELLATITDMVGAYLNAARLGPDRLKEWFEGADRNPDAAPPSFEPAATGLPSPDRAALEAFGKSDRGLQLVSVQSGRGEATGAATPRGRWAASGSTPARSSKRCSTRPSCTSARRSIAASSRPRTSTNSTRTNWVSR